MNIDKLLKKKNCNHENFLKLIYTCIKEFFFMLKITERNRKITSFKFHLEPISHQKMFLL